MCWLVFYIHLYLEKIGSSRATIGRGGVMKSSRKVCDGKKVASWMLVEAPTSRGFGLIPTPRFMDLAEVIVIIGGCDRKGLLKLPFADAYHPESRRWTALPSLPGYTRSEFAACALRNDVYVSGECGVAAGTLSLDWLKTFLLYSPPCFSLQPGRSVGVLFSC